MQKNTFKIYYFVDRFNLSDLSHLSKDISIIYRNYDNIDHLENILKLKNYCRFTKRKFYLSNNIKLSIKLGICGLYIPSFNKKINVEDLSMGMSEDYLEAVACGTTYIRIGSKIFGDRS